MIVVIIYTISCIFHAIGLYYGLRTWHEGEELFVNSSPLNFFKSEIERKFWTVFIGSSANISFLVAIIWYINTYSGNAVGNIEPWFLYAHVSGALSTAIWHHMAFVKIKKIKSGLHEISSASNY